MCGVIKTKQIMYEKHPHPAIANILIDQSSQIVCKKCALREVGSKHRKELNELEKSS